LGSVSQDRSYLERVADFCVGRHGVGEVKFLGHTDVRTLDLDAIVDINPSEVCVPLSLCTSMWCV
jgi:hypothetical protein